MSIDFVRKTQALFDIDEDLRRAELSHNLTLARVKLVDGLKESCFLLKDMLVSDQLREVESKASPDAWEFFRDLRHKNRLDDFLDIERKLLSATDLKAPAVDHIVHTLRTVIALMITRQGISPPVRALLDDLSHSVCDKASREAKSLENRPFLRRVFLAAGGSIVSGLNLMPPVILSPQISAGSVSLGIWLIGISVKGELDSWIGGKH